MDERRLNELSVGDTAVIRRLECDAALKQRLMDLGLTRGARLEVVRFAPLGDPVEIRVRGYSLTLRGAEAAGVVVSAKEG